MKKKLPCARRVYTRRLIRGVRAWQRRLEAPSQLPLNVHLPLSLSLSPTYPRVVPMELQLISRQESGIGVDVVESHPGRRFARLQCGKEEKVA